MYTSSEAIELVKRWLEIMIIGHDMCPFAKWPYQHDKVRLRVLDQATNEPIAEVVASEIALLANSPAAEIETTLIISTDSEIPLLDWNEINLDVNDFITESDHVGIIQSVMFHPAFEYGGEDPKSIINVTNRSPLPLLHLIREDSITRVIDEGADTQAIINRNSRHLEHLGWDGWQSILNDIHKA